MLLHHHLQDEFKKEEVGVVAKAGSLISNLMRSDLTWDEDLRSSIEGGRQDEDLRSSIEGDRQDEGCGAYWVCGGYVE